MRRRRRRTEAEEPEDWAALAAAVSDGQRLFEEGAALVQAGRFEDGREKLQEALRVYREAGHRAREATTLLSLGLLALELKRPDEAVALLEEAVPILHEAGDSAGEVRARLRLGELRRDRGRLHEAFDLYQRAIVLLQGGVDRGLEARTLHDLGTVSLGLGRPQEALEYFQGALEILRENGDRAGEGVALGNLGTVLKGLGRGAEALHYSQEALRIVREVGDRSAEGAALSNLGSLFDRLGRPEEALEHYQQALTILREVGDRAGEATTLGSLATLARYLERPEMALELFQQALDISREMGSTAGEFAILHNLGMLHGLLGRPGEALDHLQRALVLERQVGDRGFEVMTRSGLGQVYRHMGRIEEAREHFERAIETVEAIRGEIVTEEHRTSYFSTVGDLFADYVSVLVDQGEGERAFAAAERGRARVFIELLAEAQAQVREGVDPELRRQELETLERLTVLRGRLVEARSRPEGEMDPTLIPGLEREEQELESRLHAVEAKIRAENPRYAALTQPTAWELSEIQATLLDEDSALLEYVLAEEGSLLFCVLKDDFEVFTLPPRGEIETKVRELRTAVLHGLHRYPHGEELYRDLVAPAEALIEGKDLLVCADGALHYLPFSLLLTGPPEEGEAGGEPPDGRLRAAPGGEEDESLLEKVRADLADLAAFDFGALPFLLRRHAVSYAPSATVAAMVRVEARDGTPSHDGDLAAIADPRGLGGEREQEEGVELPVELEAALAHVRDTLEPIPATADEVWALAGLVAARLPKEHPERLDRPKVVLRTASAATKEEVEALTSGERSFRFLHIATHGLLDPEKPQFSGLVFTAAGGKDPFWRTFEIFNARIPSELVVLSACETGLGRIVSGEGIVGLTRAFLYAGAPSVCVSLWKVAEESSPELMEGLYRRILAGEPKAAALRGAQLELVEETSYSHPFWWAPFVLVGEGG